MQRKHMKEKRLDFGNGATRSDSGLIRYDLVPPQGGLRTAIRFGLGATKHPAKNPRYPGEGNWKQGGAAFVRATVGHMIWHINKLLLGHDVGDDHLGAIGWAQAALAWYEANKPKDYREGLRQYAGIF